MDRKTTLAFAFAALCLFGAVTIGGVSADTTANNTTVESVEPVGEAGYTISELRQSGSSFENTPDSWRLSQQQFYWVIHWPADTAFARPGDTDDNNWQYLSDGEVVERNSVWLRTMNVEGTETVDVTIVSYKTEETENGTIPVDVRERTTEAELELGQSLVEIDLPQFTEEREVAMWVDGREDELRWHFRHDAVATTQPMTITTMGGYLQQAAIDFLIPLIGGVFVAGFLGRSALQRAHMGPQWGYTKWLMLIGVAGFIGSFFLFSSIADVVVATPRIVALAIVALFTIVLIESYTTNVTRARFERPETLDEIMSPSGDQAYDAIGWEEREEYLVRDGNGTSVVRPGLLPFLSRCFGGAARLENAAAIETRLPTNTDIEKYYISMEADELLTYKPEGWGIQLPEIDPKEDWQRVGVAGAAAALIVGSVWYALSTPLALGVLLVLLGLTVVRPQDGFARIEPASVHERRAYVSTKYLMLEVEDAKTMRDMEQKIPELEAEVRRTRSEALREQNQTLVEETLSDEAVAHTIDELAERLNGTSDETTNGTGESSEADEREAEQ